MGDFDEMRRLVGMATYNTYIGGVGGVITTATALATKLGISPSDITDFEIYGTNNIRCNVNINYSIPFRTFNFTGGHFPYNVITHFVDIEGRCISLDTQTFQGQSNLDFIFLPNLSSGGINGSQGFRFCTGLTVAYFYGDSGFNRLGSTTGNDGVFGGSASTGLDIYIRDFFQTINSGSPDGDLTAVTFDSITYLSSSAIPSAVQSKINSII